MIWWALSLGACLGGNGTLVGASSNLVAVSLAKKHGIEISFSPFMKYGLIDYNGSYYLWPIYILFSLNIIWTMNDHFIAHVSALIRETEKCSWDKKMLF